MTTDLAVDRLMIQAKDGGQFRFQATAQGFFLARGFVSGLVLSLLALPLAVMFDLRQSVWAFAALGLVPFVRGCAHLDYVRAQRDLSFRSTAVVEIVSNVVSTLACLPLALLVGDASAIVWVNLVRAVAIVLVSHWLAERPYAIRLERALVQRFSSFGWPLIVDGWVLFAMFHGDRIVIALTSTMEDLGRCGIVFQLSMVASLVLARSAISLWLPLLSRAQHQSEEFEQHYETGLKVLACVSLAFIAGFMAAGNLVIELLYGARYQVSPALVGWLAVMHGVRVVRTMPSIAAMARADSQTPMIGNLFRLSGVIGSVAAGAGGLGLEGIVAAGCAGEVVAGLASFALIQRLHGLPLSRAWPPVAFVLAGSGVSAVLFLWLDLPWFAKWGAACLIELALVLAMWQELVNAGLARSPLFLKKRLSPVIDGAPPIVPRAEPT
jgi:O-antigen/teichoic acid export membrane protein